MFKNNRLTQPVLIGVILSVIIAIIAFGANRVYASEMTQTDQSSTTASIKWDAPEGGDIACYFIGWGDDFKAAKKMVDSQNNKISAGYSSYTIEDLKPGHKYVVYITYKVKTSGVIQPLVEDGVIHTGPAKVTGVKVLSVDNIAKTMTFSWKTQEGASGYEYTLKNAAGKTVKKDRVVSGTESLIKLDIDNKDFYKFSVRAYSNRFGKDVYGASSSVIYAAAQPEITKASVSDKGLSLTWNNVKGAKNYTVYISRLETSGYKKVTTTSKNTYLLKKFTGSKIDRYNNYYIYVIADTKKDGKTYKSFKNMYNAVKGNQIAAHVFE